MNETAPNPYSPPRSNVASPEDARSLEDAGKGRRFGTMLIDYFLYLVLSFCIGAGTVLLFGNAGVQALQSIPDLLLGVIIIAGYYLFFEGLWARTPGKFILGTVVISESGERPSFGQIVGRTFSRLIPFEPFSFLGERGWHDSLSKTRVVMIRSR